MNLHTLLRPRFAALAAAVGLLAACGGGGSSSTPPSSDTGTLRIALTDAPSCGYDEVNVTVEKVRVHRSASAGENDSGWSEVVLTPALRVNLLDLTNGVLAELGHTELPAGTYTQLRLQLAANGGAAPYANSLVLSGSADEIPLDTPSAQQSGLKMNVNVTVESNEVADLVLDFDACKSVVKRGNSGRYNLKPVVSVLPRVRVDGLVAEGYVAPAIALGSTSVSLQIDGVPVRSTVPMANGRFVLYPVPAGNYDLVVSAEGRVTAVMTGVPISASSRTFVTPTGTAIDPPAGAPRAATGVVSISGSTTVPQSLVRATQFIGTTVAERTARPSDALSGEYLLSLAAGAPVFTAYDPVATSLAFTADAANAGKFRLEALTDGKLPVTADIDVTSTDIDTPLVFAP
ncbi:MAG: DUF4382 domain-containing protein [Piscinibacter sp.]